MFHNEQNIQYDGRVCLNILKEDWTPAQNLCSVMMGLIFLMVCPNADDPLDIEAAKFMREKPDEFQRQVRACLKGTTYNGRKYDCLL